MNVLMGVRHRRQDGPGSQTSIVKAVDTESLEEAMDMAMNEIPGAKVVLALVPQEVMDKGKAK